MTTNPIPPALTAAQWEDLIDRISVRDPGDGTLFCSTTAADIRRNPAAAIAIANHQMPAEKRQRISRADVDALRSVAKSEERWLTEFAQQSATSNTAQRLYRLADILESYLPPEEK